MLTLALVALVLTPAVQLLLVVKMADRLPAEAITGREPRNAILPTTWNSANNARDRGLRAAGRYAQVA